MVDPTLVPQGYRPLTRRGLGLSDQEAAVDPAGEEVLGSVPGDGAVVPGVLLQGVDGGDVVGGDPAHVAQDGVGLAPLPGLVVGEDPNLETHNLVLSPL